jgi:hypothetical protein
VARKRLTRLEILRPKDELRIMDRAIFFIDEKNNPCEITIYT